MEPHEIGIFVRAVEQIARGVSAISKADLSSNVLNKRMEGVVDKVSLSTMHLAKELEFKAVIDMVCNDGITPLEDRLSTVAGDAGKLTGHPSQLQTVTMGVLIVRESQFKGLVGTVISIKAQCQRFGYQRTPGLAAATQLA